MMDYMSEQPGPTAEAAVAWAMSELEQEATAQGISRLALKRHAERGLEHLGGSEKLGSQAGWMMFTSKVMVEHTRKSMKTPLEHPPVPTERFRTVAKAVGKFAMLFRRSADRVWAPGGVGFDSAKTNFSKMTLTDNKQTLPNDFDLYNSPRTTTPSDKTPTGSSQDSVIPKPYLPNIADTTYI